MFRLTEGLLDEFGKDRVLDTPLAESAILGTSIGMAMAGLKPVCEMQFSGFSYLMIGQWEGNATRMRSRTHGQFTASGAIRLARQIEPFDPLFAALSRSVQVRVVAPGGPCSPCSPWGPVSPVLARVTLQ